MLALAACQTATVPLLQLPKPAKGSEWRYIPNEKEWRYRVRVPANVTYKAHDLFRLPSGVRLSFIPSPEAADIPGGGPMAVKQLLKEPPKSYEELHEVKAGEFIGARWIEGVPVDGEKYFFGGKGHGIIVSIRSAPPGTDLTEARSVLRSLLETIEFPKNR